MVLGADVTHPTGGGKSESGEKSIAAVVGSRDRSMCRYASRMLVQDSGAEVGGRAGRQALPGVHTPAHGASSELN